MAYGAQTLLNNIRNERIDMKTSRAIKSLCRDRQTTIDDETLKEMRKRLSDLDNMVIESRMGAGLTRLIMR